MGWLVDYFELDDEQKEFVDRKDIEKRNIWIKGFPGSGKSVLLAYALRRIMNKNPNANIIVVVYTYSLIAMFNAAFKEMNLPKPVKVITYFQFMKTKGTYDYILCDEVQDLTSDVLSTMKRRGTHVIVSGDENQSIYENTVSPSQINNLLDAESYGLHMIHRLTQDIIKVVKKFLPKLNLFNSKIDLRHDSVQVILGEGHNILEEAKYIMKEGERAIRINEAAAILLPTHNSIISFINKILSSKGKPEWQTQLNNYGKPDFNQLNSHLEKNNIAIQYVGNSYGSFLKYGNKITIMTYHSSKGLDFEHVFLPEMNSSQFISYDEDLSKVLFMVAMTRSKKNLYITYSGNKHAYIDKFAGDCHLIDIHDNLSGQTIINSSNNIFGF